MRVTVIPTVIGALSTVSKHLEKRLREQREMRIRGKIETNHKQYCSDQLKYLEESWRSAETCSQSNFSEDSPVRVAVKNLQDGRKMKKI